MKLRPPSPALTVAIIALLVAMSGSAIASSLITSAQIKNGTIQIKDLSRSAIAKLHGSRGAPGAPGAQGAQGIQGPVGPSEVFTFVHEGNITLPHAPVSASIPAGTYLIFARVQVNNNGNHTERPECTLKAGTDVDKSLLGTSQTETNDDTADVTLMVTHTFGAPGTASLQCESGVETELEDVSLSAIRVGKATVGSL